MTELDFESAQLQLLTDALRAGPGSPEWRAALASVGGSTGDEYKALYAARERLASGRAYREVRPGAGFTRKVFEGIDEEESAASKKPGSANFIAAVSALVILGILAVVAYFAMPRGQTTPTPALSQTYFVNTISQSAFDGEQGMDWAAFGALGVDAKNGLQPVLKSLNENYRGGGVFYERAQPANDPISMQATLVLPRPTTDVVVEIFITDDPNFTGDSATSEHELACVLRGSEASIVSPGGHVEKQGVQLATGSSAIEVHVNVGGDDAAIEIGGKNVWSGKSGLDAAKTRLAGVRFLAKARKNLQPPVVQLVRLMKP